MSRQRYLSRDEVVDMLARVLHRDMPELGHLGNYSAAGIVVDELVALGVKVDGVIKADVDENDVVTYPESRTEAEQS